MTAYKIVSSDDHIDTAAWPPDLFTSRVPAKWRDKAPRVVETPDGNFWQVGGNLGSPTYSQSGMSKGRRIPNAITRAGIDDNGFRPSNPKLRLQDMDLDGVYAQVIYGPVVFPDLGDPELTTVFVRAFNDWAMEFNSVDPDRLAVLPYILEASGDRAAEELRRCAKMGHKSVIFASMARPVHDPTWEPLWAAADEWGMPMSFHFSPTRLLTLRSTVNSWTMPATASCLPKSLDEPLASMIFSGNLDRHRKMTMVLGEAGLGWLPYMLERMDHCHKKYLPYTRDHRLSMLPSEVFRRQVYVTFEAEEELGLKLLPYIGVDNVMWASDYPHPDSTFPNSQQCIQRVLGGMDPEARRKITCDNAARVYGIKGALAVT